ncbi:MAG: 50S ribosomal protein L18e [Methanocalculus sp. MSAO_Arc1]|uniref:50S ribosomal protein L18e n=1 Tax=Methanocalculus TaxID=71151 RepID=UPI000FEF62F3|nr:MULTISPECIES: 50S ribosomal protein L18e [unclassified Methanocalculus]MCP1662242.1 large subunit ribosomal protein L18e [Methanocalculus sp. AMF5]RQD81696.1 MAG: 50S ribosomal protein L18e [Methanocalculus sp. MSAO_Arc1]
MKRTGKTNPRLDEVIRMLRTASNTNEATIWREIACRLDTSSRNYAEVNIGKINRYAQGGEIILVPGKVLGSGVLDQSVRVAALNFSESAREKIIQASGDCMTIEELVMANPQGSRVRILR